MWPRSNEISLSIRHICIIGAGYVGTTTAAVLATKHPKINLTVVDCDKDRINGWNSQQPPIQEPHLSATIASVRKCNTNGNVALEEPADDPVKRRSNLEFSVDIDGAILDADMIFITVNTPAKLKGKGWDLTYFDAALRQIAETAESDKIIVTKSTVPCGNAQHTRKYLEQYGRKGVNFTVLSNPEFMRQGFAVNDFLNPARVIIGYDTPNRTQSDAVLLLRSLYSAWISPSRILLISTASAELAKIASNAMIAQRISNANALSALCEATGAKVSDVTLACGMDPRIGPEVLQAGLGFGGSCLRKDLLGLENLALDHNLHEVASYWKQILMINDYQGKRLFRKILTLFDDNLEGVKVGILGFAYKKATCDGRESPVKALIIALLKRGARVSVHDPLVSGEDIRLEVDANRKHDAVINPAELKVHPDIMNACRGGELIIVATDADEYQCIDWKTMSRLLCGRRILFDMRGIVDRDQLVK